MTEVVNFRQAGPAARLKQFERDDVRPRCKHRQIEIWPKEPIIECAQCGAVVDPYYWIRQRCADWDQAEADVQWRINAAKLELDDLKLQLRRLRGEFNNEAEKRRAPLMILPPQSTRFGP